MSQAQLVLPFDSAQLSTGQVGSLAVLRYRGRIAIAVMGKDGNMDSIEADDGMLAELAAQFMSRRAA